MRQQSFVFVLTALAICFGASTRLALAQQEEKAVGSDTTGEVIVSNYYYGGYPSPAYLWYPPYPRYYGYYYPRVFVGFSGFVPFHHRYYPRGFRHFYGYGPGRNVGYHRGSGMVRGGTGRARY